MTLFKTLISYNFGGQFTKNYGTQKKTNTTAMYIDSILSIEANFDIVIRRREVKISLDLSREFAYDAGKVKEFKTKVRAPKGSGKGKKSFSVPSIN